MLMCYPLLPWPHAAGGNSLRRHPSLHPISIYHTHTRKKPLTIIFPLTIPRSSSSHCWDEKWLSSIISKTDSPTDLLSAFKPSLSEFMEKIKCGVKLHFLLNSASHRQNPTQTWAYMLGCVWKVTELSDFSESNWLWSSEQCRGRKYLHMWVLTCAGMYGLARGTVLMYDVQGF